MSRRAVKRSVLCAGLLLAVGGCQKSEEAEAPRSKPDRGSAGSEEAGETQGLVPPGFQTFKPSAFGERTSRLELELPEDWKHETDRGLDFDVHWFRAPEGGGYLGIYIGHDPIWRPSPDSEVVDEEVGSRHVPFHRAMREDVVTMEGVADNLFADDPQASFKDLRLHLMVKAGDAEVLAAARQGLRSLRTIKPPSQIEVAGGPAGPRRRKPASSKRAAR